MKGEEMARIWEARAEEPDIDGWVWDGADGHKGADMQAIGAPRVVQPFLRPRPGERFFQELRWALGDWVFQPWRSKRRAWSPS